MSEGDTAAAREAKHVRKIIKARKRLERADRELRETVTGARSAGITWQVIGSGLKLTKQGAYQRFGKNGN